MISKYHSSGIFFFMFFEMVIILRLLLFTGVVFAQFGFLEQPKREEDITDQFGVRDALGKWSQILRKVAQKHNPKIYQPNPRQFTISPVVFKDFKIPQDEKKDIINERLLYLLLPRIKGQPPFTTTIAPIVDKISTIVSSTASTTTTTTTTMITSIEMKKIITDSHISTTGSMTNNSDMTVSRNTNESQENGKELSSSELVSLEREFRHGVRVLEKKEKKQLDQDHIGFDEDTIIGSTNNEKSVKENHSQTNGSLSVKSIGMELEETTISTSKTTIETTTPTEKDGGPTDKLFTTHAKHTLTGEPQFTVVFHTAPRSKYETNAKIESTVLSLLNETFQQQEMRKNIDKNVKKPDIATIANSTKEVNKLQAHTTTEDANKQILSRNLTEDEEYKKNGKKFRENSEGKNVDTVGIEDNDKLEPVLSKPTTEMISKDEKSIKKSSTVKRSTEFTTTKPNKEKSLDKYVEDANMTTNNEIKIQMSDEISIRNMLKQKEFDSGELYEHRITTAQYSPLIETARTTKEIPQNSKVAPTIKLAIDEIKREKEANMSKEERANEMKLVKPSNENEEEEELANEATEVLALIEASEKEAKINSSKLLSQLKTKEKIMKFLRGRANKTTTTTPSPKTTIYNTTKTTAIISSSATALVSSTTQPLQVASKENIVDKVALKHLTGKQDIPEAEEEEDVQAPQAAGGLTSNTTFAPLNISKEDTLSILKANTVSDPQLINVISPIAGILDGISPILIPLLGSRDSGARASGVRTYQSDSTKGVMHSQNGEHSLFGYGTQLAKEMLNAASANMNKQKHQDTATGRIIKANEVNKAEINDEQIDIGAFKIGKTVSPIETVSFTPTIVDQVKQPFHQPQQSAYTSYHSSLPLSAYQAPFTSAVTVPPFFFPPPPGYKGPLPPAPPPPPGYGAHPLSATLFIETSPPPGYSGPMPPPPPPPFGFVPEGYSGQLLHNSAIYPNVVLNQQPQLIRNQVRLGSALPLLTNMSYYPSISGSGIDGPFSAFSTEDTTKTIKSFDHSVRMDKTSQIKEMDAVGVSKEYHEVTNDSGILAGPSILPSNIFADLNNPSPTLVLSQDPAKRTSKGLSGFGGGRKPQQSFEEIEVDP